jgi:ABC-type sugar transport system permease subunit
MVTIGKGKSLNSKGAVLFIVAILIIPIIHWLIFWFGVNINSILMAFQIPTGEWSFETMESVLKEIFSNDSNAEINLNTSIKNTFIYFIKDILMLPFHLLIAYFFYKKLAGYRVFQVIFYLPSIISGVAFSTMFSNFIALSGPIGVLLSSAGVNPVPEFLANSDYATATILFYTIWIGWGGNMLLLGGALARVPLEILESARLDGISPAKELIYMILPLIWSTLSTLLILSMTSLFIADGPILLFTRGKFQTATIGYWIFDRVYFQGVGAYNSVAAAGLVFTVIGAPIILFVKWLIERVPVVEY